MSTIIMLGIISGVMSLICLMLLHIVSSEFKPSWQMVSEYALGKHKWLLTSFFIFWSINNLLAAYFYFNIVSTKWAAFGAILVFISGLGALMGGLFDMKHKLHGLSFVFGVPTFPVGALLIAYHLINQNNWLPYKNELLISAYSVLVSLVLMKASMGLFFSGLKKAGVQFGPNQEPIKQIPESVIGVNGLANRFLVLAYVAFNIIVSLIFINL